MHQPEGDIFAFVARCLERKCAGEVNLLPRTAMPVHHKIDECMILRGDQSFEGDLATTDWCNPLCAQPDEEVPDDKLLERTDESFRYAHFRKCVLTIR